MFARNYNIPLSSGSGRSLLAGGSCPFTLTKEVLMHGLGQNLSKHLSDINDHSFSHRATTELFMFSTCLGVLFGALNPLTPPSVAYVESFCFRPRLTYVACAPAAMFYA
ncbi:hypothetical protein J6590_036030 [Homalodisca vitripennis]|nr:hypothetical protein J6590_072491 [Homalodisca vitripennis]KAG8306953.1 hypothetical protein J6590_036030 [Homalodisca vitripennis]